MYVCMYVCMHVCMYIYIYIYTYIYTYTYTYIIWPARYLQDLASGNTPAESNVRGLKAGSPPAPEATGSCESLHVPTISLSLSLSLHVYIYIYIYVHMSMSLYLCVYAYLTHILGTGCIT